MRSLCFLTLSMVLSSASLFATPSALKISVVDLERVVKEVVDGVKARAELKKEFDAKQMMLDGKQAEVKNLQGEIEKLQGEIEKSGSLMKPSVKEEKNMHKEEKNMQLQKKVMETQQLYMTMQQDIQKREQELMGVILQKVSVILERMREESGDDFFVRKDAVLASKQHLDRTNEAIRIYNDVHGTAKNTGKQTAQKRKG